MRLVRTGLGVNTGMEYDGESSKESSDRLAFSLSVSESTEGECMLSNRFLRAAANSKQLLVLSGERARSGFNGVPPGDL